MGRKGHQAFPFAAQVQKPKLQESGKLPKGNGQEKETHQMEIGKMIGCWINKITIMSFPSIILFSDLQFGFY
jgi:hypothetical protein